MSWPGPAGRQGGAYAVGVNVRRVVVAVLASAATFAVLWWAASALGWMRQDLPVGRLLEGRPDVVSYGLRWHGDVLQVEVVPAAGVDLPAFYASLLDDLGEILGGRRFELRLGDRRDEVLAETMRVLRFYVEEAQATGRFTWADEMVSRVAASRGLEWARLGMDSDRIYVELRHGSAYLYEVIPRAAR